MKGHAVNQPFLVIALLMTVSAVNSHDEVRTRDKRSDDVPALDAVVATLSQRVDQLTAQLVTLGGHMTQLQERLNTVEQPVAFWVRFNQFDISGLSPGQTLKFDNVLYNAGSAFNVHTGIFTAPSAGTYVFFVRVMTHSGDTDNVYLDLVVNGHTWAEAWASGMEYNEGFTTATLHLAAGDNVFVNFGGGADHTLWGAWHTSFSGFRIAN